MMVDLWMPYMLISMTLTLMQGHSGLAKAKYQRCMLSATKQAISIKLATTVGLFFYVTLTLTLQTLYGLSNENEFVSSFFLSFCLSEKYFCFCCCICSFFI